MRVGGIIEIKIDGTLYKAKGEFTYNLGVAMKEAVVGADAVHGYKETPKAPFIEGAITDQVDLDVKALQKTSSATCTLSLANGKVVVLKDAWYASEGDISSEEGEIAFKMEGMSAEEIR